MASSFEQTGLSTSFIQLKALTSKPQFGIRTVNPSLLYELLFCTFVIPSHKDLKCNPNNIDRCRTSCIPVLSRCVHFLDMNSNSCRIWM